MFLKDKEFTRKSKGEGREKNMPDRGNVRHQNPER